MSGNPWSNRKCGWAKCVISKRETGSIGSAEKKVPFIGSPAKCARARTLQVSIGGRRGEPAFSEVENIGKALRTKMKTMLFGSMPGLYIAIQYNTNNTIKCKKIQYNTIKYHTIQYNTKQENIIKYNTIQYNTIQ